MSMDAAPLADRERDQFAPRSQPPHGRVSRSTMDVLHWPRTSADDKDRWLHNQVEGWAAARSL